MTTKTGLSRRLDVAVEGLLLQVEGGIHLGLREEPTLGRWGDRTSGGAEEGGAHARAEEGANRSFHDRHTAALWGCEQAQRRSGEVIRLETGMVRSMSEDATPPSKHHGLIVVIDGPAGAGKSTVARRVAQALELPVLDTGAIYRTVALAGDRAGVPWTDGEGLAALASTMPLVFVAASVARSGRQEVWLGDEEVTDAIRTPHVSDGASRVSSLPPVRAALLDLQRKLGTSGCVGEGRDLGTVVFPAADHKFFLTASTKVRAERRHRELVSRGGDVPSLAEVLAAMNERDARDSGREVAPLARADDAREVDSSGATIDEVVAEILRHVDET